jgi:hypothetical protein
LKHLETILLLSVEIERLSLSVDIHVEDAQSWRTKYMSQEKYHMQELNELRRTLDNEISEKVYNT